MKGGIVSVAFETVVVTERAAIVVVARFVGANGILLLCCTFGPLEHLPDLGPTLSFVRHPVGAVL